MLLSCHISVTCPFLITLLRSGEIRNYQRLDLEEQPLRKQIPMSVCYLEQFCPSPASTLWIGKLKADLSLLLCILHFLWHTSLTVSQKGCKIQEKAGKAALPLHFCSCTMKTDTKCRGSTLSSCPIFTFEIRYFLEIKIKNPHSKTFGSFSAPCAFWIKAVS